MEELRTYRDWPIAPISRPTRGALGLTGTWRTFRPVINEERCAKCLMCWLFCPESAIEVDEEGRPVINYDYCKGCGVCASECRYGAVQMVREEGIAL